jgi:hypothetical protein
MGDRRAAQANVELLQAQLKATQATADLEATLRAFEGYLTDGKPAHLSCSVLVQFGN